MKTAIAFLLLSLVSCQTLAETIVRFDADADAHANAATITAGYDYSIVTMTLGYARAVHLSKIQRTLVLDLGLGIPLMAFDFKDFKINLGGQMSLVNIKRFALPVSFDILLRNNHNEAYSVFGIGTVLGIYPGYYTDNLTIAAEALWDAQLASYIRFSDYYKSVIYEDGKEGWYGATGHIFRFGARVGGLIKRRLEIYLRGGFELQGKYNVKIPPAYGVLGISTRF